METQNGMSRRVNRLEERAEARHVRRVAARMADALGCSADALLAEAERVADMVEAHGRDRAVELVAAEVRVTPEELERGAERFQALVSEP